MQDLIRQFNTVLLLLMCSIPVQADISAAALPLTLRLNDTNEPPLTTAQHDGFLDIIATETFARVGIKLKLIKLPAERALLNANAGIDDGELTRIAGLEKLYPNLVRVPEKLIDWEFTAFAKTTAIPANWQDIRRHVVGHITGWKIYEQQLGGDSHVVSTANPAQLFQLLDRNHIEVALYARWMGQAFIQKMGLKGIHRLSPNLSRRQMYIYLNKRYTRVIPKITASLQALKREGFYERIRQEKLAQYQ